ncbi:hypothetical protein Zm00014a_028142 [Zea mays]|uniref:Uncharacterized protein n=1 Tax=Zea mays TaxID=4577 RepID=A0A3L6EI63_MAIZE|nr:hypothetical protein Zm00014a_028142 [Zea mays]
MINQYSTILSSQN